jgi:hypothetical protein
VPHYTNDALADLASIRAWLTQPGSGSTARRRPAAIRAAIRRLKHDPFPVGGHAGTRALPCERGYRAMYDLHPDAGRSETAGDELVLRVFSPGQERGSL